MIVKSEKVLRHLSFLTALIIINVLISVSVTAQTDPSRPTPGRASDPDRLPPRSPSPAAQPVIVAGSGDYHLAVSDVVEIIIEDAPELSGNYRVNKAGSIPMKYLGSIDVVGKSAEDVTTIIANGLRGRYLKDPKVYITVRQYNSRTFFIQGSVRSPGVYVIEGQPSLFKLISIAGGLGDNHGSTAYIIRETKPSPEQLERERAGIPRSVGQQSAQQSGGPRSSSIIGQALAESGTDQHTTEGDSEYEMVTANISGLFRGRFEQNLIIQPNDLVYIPPADVFFVAGEVKAPGQFRLREGTTIRQAISLAQGTTFKAAGERARIFRQDLLTGKLTEIAVDIGAIMNGRNDDVAIMPNDVLMVPNSRMKSVAGAMMMSLGMGIAQTAAWSIFR